MYLERKRHHGALGKISQRKKGESGPREQDGYKYLKVLFLVEERYFWSCLIAHRVSKYNKLSTFLYNIVIVLNLIYFMPHI